MTNAINQMQMLYVPEEDRILFRLNSTDKKEFRLWMTRRFTLLLDKVLRTHLSTDPDVSTQGSPEAKQAISDFKQEKAKAGANFKQSFDDKPTEIPLGDKIPLAFKINYKIEGENLQLTMEPKNGPGINVVINRQITANLMQLLKNATKQGEWPLSSAPAEVIAPSQPVVN